MEPYRRDVPELSQPIDLVVEGAIPASVRGWYFRNGPGKFSVGGTRVAHPFDGDGAICKIHLTAPKSATFMNQYVKTEEYAPAREFHNLARSLFLWDFQTTAPERHFGAPGLLLKQLPLVRWRVDHLAPTSKAVFSQMYWMCCRRMRRTYPFCGCLGAYLLSLRVVSHMSLIRTHCRL